jgi:DNA-binding transcriptional MerR regulator
VVVFGPTATEKEELAKIVTLEPMPAPVVNSIMAPFDFFTADRYVAVDASNVGNPFDDILVAPTPELQSPDATPQQPAAPVHVEDEKNPPKGLSPEAIQRVNEIQKEIDAAEKRLEELRRLTATTLSPAFSGPTPPPSPAGKPAQLGVMAFADVPPPNPFDSVPTEELKRLKNLSLKTELTNEQTFATLAKIVATNPTTKDFSRARQLEEVADLRAKIAEFQKAGVSLMEMVHLTASEEAKFPPNEHEKQLLMKHLRLLREKAAYLEKKRTEREQAAKNITKTQGLYMTKVREVAELEAKLANFEKTMTAKGPDF